MEANRQTKKEAKSFRDKVTNGTQFVGNMLQKNTKEGKKFFFLSYCLNVRMVASLF